MTELEKAHLLIHPERGGRVISIQCRLDFICLFKGNESLCGIRHKATLEQVE